MLKTIIFTIIATFIVTLSPTTQAYAAASIGRIVHSYGPAWVQRGAVRESATKGQVVLRNDSIVTGARGRVKIIMSDGSKVYVGSKSRVSLRKYSMRGGKLFNARINMLWGKARFFVNKLTTRGSSFRVRTPTAVLGVRGTEFIVLVPPTPEVLALAFADITLADIPQLPTSTILSEGAVDVSFGETGKVERLLPGHTAHVNKEGKVTLQKTKKDDAEIKDLKPEKDPVGRMGNGKNPDKKDTLGVQRAPNSPKARDLPKRPAKLNLGDAIQANIADIPSDTVNAIQNLDNTTEIIINPSFVAPGATAPTDAPIGQ